LHSDALASVLAERPARVRMLGETRMVPLNSTAFVVVTGNGLTATEDLARRFILCELDARCEDPKLRSFAAGFLEDIERRRSELLTAALTIWRWGCQNTRVLRAASRWGASRNGQNGAVIRFWPSDAAIPSSASRNSRLGIPIAGVSRSCFALGGSIMARPR
jgi:hypothetical protein